MKHSGKAKARKEESSFLKKRSKKLLLLRPADLGRMHGRLARSQTSKSFLVLFFKKEHFFLYLPYINAHERGGPCPQHEPGGFLPLG
jgi:hypothetical protein